MKNLLFVISVSFALFVLPYDVVHASKGGWTTSSQDNTRRGKTTSVLARVLPQKVQTQVVKAGRGKLDERRKADTQAQAQAAIEQKKQEVNKRREDANKEKEKELTESSQLESDIMKRQVAEAAERNRLLKEQADKAKAEKQLQKPTDESKLIY